MYKPLAIVWLLVLGANGWTDEEWETAVRSANEDYSDALNARDLDALANLLTDDVHFIPYGRPKVLGKSEVLQFYTDLIKRGNFPVAFKISLDYLRWHCNDSAVSEELIDHLNTDDTVFTGKAVRLYHRENNQLKMAMSIWNSD